MNLSLLLEELLLELSPDEIQKKYYTDIPSGVFYGIALADPQTVVNPENKHIIRIGKYTKILLNLFQKKTLKQEDISKATEYLTYAYKYHVPLDINKINTLSDIYNSVKKYMNIDSKDLGVIMNSLSSDDYQTLYDGNQWLILQPLNEKAACYLGVNTQWCTTYGPYSLEKSYQDRDNMFNRYNQQGRLYIMINKKDNNEKYQFHFESKQFMDSTDRQINAGKVLGKNPEIRNFFFTSFVKEPTKEQLEWELKNIDLLSQDDALSVITRLTTTKGIKNPLANSILTKDRERINILIQDEELKNSVDVKGNWIIFYFRKLSDELSSISSTLQQMRYDLSNSWEHVSGDQENQFDEEQQWINGLEPIFKEYFEKNEYNAQYELGTPIYENFHQSYFQGFMENQDIRDELIKQITSLSHEGYEDDVQKNIDHVEEYLTIDGTKVSIKNTKFIQFIVERKINKINNNLHQVLIEYIDSGGDLASEEYEYYYNYDTKYPTYKEMESTVDRYFNDMIDDMDNTRECIKHREDFNNLYSNFFKNNPTYENKHVFIHINDTRVNCIDGTVNITYKNKDKKKEYRGDVKITNLPVYATNYELFENYIRFRENTKGVL